MRILLIRHGDPDYVRDVLTETGKKEAELLSSFLAGEQIDAVYQSPHGRAKETASFYLKRTGKQAETCQWLREFQSGVDVNWSTELQAAYPDTEKEDGRYVPRIAWDVLPSYLGRHPELLDRNGWRKSELALHGRLLEEYDWVVHSFDALLEEYGYRKTEYGYHVEQESTKTVALFCHFGVSCVLLSRLWDISPFVPWHDFCMQPTSVTELVTEEREKGMAIFRALRIGDIGHLKADGREGSYPGRFTEIYSDEAGRH